MSFPSKRREYWIRNTKTLVLRLVSVSELVKLLMKHPELVTDSVSYSRFKQSHNYSDLGLESLESRNPNPGYTFWSRLIKLSMG